MTILCVPDCPEVVEVVDAAIDALGPGKIVVDTSTIDPEVERVQHERVTATGAGYLDAPLSGGTVGAENGTLTLMVGGDAAVLDVARPALEPFAGLIVHAGGPGVGQVVKLCNQLVYAAQMLAVAEASTLAVKEGVDLGVRLRGADPRDRRLHRDPHAHPVRGRAARHAGVERLEARVHDRADGQGRRPRVCAKPRARAYRRRARAWCGRCSAPRSTRATGAKTSRRSARSCGRDAGLE